MSSFLRYDQTPRSSLRSPVPAELTVVLVVGVLLSKATEISEQAQDLAHILRLQADYGRIIVKCDRAH